MRINRKILLVLLAWGILKCSKAQINLVPNHSFEEYHYCNFYAFTLKDWYIAKSTPDYFNEICYNFLPLNPIDGNAYVGILCYEKNVENSREYIQVELKENLKSQKVYCVELLIARRNRTISVKGIGILFTPYKIIDSTYSNVFLQYSPNLLLDTILMQSGWYNITFKYKAIGNEKILTIGNFYSDANTNPTFLDSTNTHDFSYYLFDKINIFECEEDSIPTAPPLSSDSSLHYKVPNVISPNGDGLNDAFVLESRGIKELSVKVYNRWGEEVVSRKVSGISTDVLSKTILWDATHKGQVAPQGVYYYLIELSTKAGEIIIEKGTVTIL